MKTHGNQETLQGLTVNFVDTYDEAGRFLEWVSQRRPFISVDTETTGLEWDAKVRLIQFGDGEQGWAIPVLRWRGVAEEGLRRIADFPIVFHNAAYDMHRLSLNGYPVPAWPRVEDTMILSRLHQPHRAAGLKPVMRRTFGAEAVAGQSLLDAQMRENKYTWATVPDDLPAYWQYGALDTCLTALLYEQVHPLVPVRNYDREMSVLEIMWHAEQRGLRIDPEYTSALKADWQTEIEELRAVLQEQAGIDNPGSNVQVTAALKQAGWEPEEFTDTGLPKLDKVVMTALAGKYGDFAPQVLRYRRLVKWTSTYLDVFLRDRDGNDRVHPQINTLGARTGRKSITNPPLQTLPSGESSIRNCILPYHDDHALYAIDYDNMEMRIFASYTQDDALVAAARSEDFHRTTAAAVFGCAPEDVTKEQRSIAKTVNFANVYGAGRDKMAQQAGTDRATVDAYLATFNARFPGAQQFKNGVDRQGKLRIASEGEGYITTCGGRRLPCDPDKVYALVNYLCQGGGADVFKDSIIALDAEGFGDNIVLPIHDEALLSFPKDDGEEMSKRAREIMEDHTTFAVPLTCGIEGPMQRWEAKP